MKKYGSKNANASVEKNTTRKMLNMPFCAYCVQISTTFFESATDALVTLSRLMLALMNSTARYAPVVTACIEAPVNQKITEPPVISPSKNGGYKIDRFFSSSGCSPCVSAMMIEKIIVVAPTTAVPISTGSVSYTHLRAHETGRNLVCRLL